jgi:cytochrome P450
VPEGGVLVVGPSSSGVQISEEVHLSGRPVTLATGEHVGFTRARLAILEDRITETVDSLLDDLAAYDGPVDLVAGFALPLPFSVIGELLGIDPDGQRRLAGWFATLMAPYAGDVPPAAAVAASDEIVAYLNDLVDRRLAEPTEDLVGDLARAANEGTITRKELLCSLFQLIVAGHHTTTSLIGNGVVALLQQPAQRDALAADPSLVPQAIEEFLRYDALVPHSTFRYAARDLTIAGTPIPAGVPVIVTWPRQAATRPGTTTRRRPTSAAPRPTT